MNIVDEIKTLFAKQPSNMQGIRELLRTHNLTKEELAALAIDFVDTCMDEYLNSIDTKYKFEKRGNLCNDYIIRAIELLLEFGFDPNAIIDDDNVMWNTMYIKNPNVAATVFRLLLENGANPNLWIPGEPETIFEYIDFKVSYDEYTHEYFHTVQCWLVLMAYGACWTNGEIPLTMLGGNSVEIFKNFELYDYEIEELPQIPGRYGCWIMHIFNAETREEVAVYK